MKITVPASIEDAQEKLGALGRLLTATEWERAAIIAAFVHCPGSGRLRGEKGVNGTSAIYSTTEFAALGIVGLKSHHTVARYHDAWMDSGKPRPRPGEVVDLPTQEFPATSKTDGTEPGAQKVKDIQNNAKATAKALEKPETAAKVVSNMSREAKQEIAAAIANDPEANRVAGLALTKANADKNAEWQSRRDNAAAADKQASKQSRFAALEVGKHLAHAREALDAATHALRGIPMTDENREVIAMDLRQTEAAFATFLKEWENPGSTDWDAALADLNGGN